MTRQTLFDAALVFDELTKRSVPCLHHKGFHFKDIKPGCSFRSESDCVEKGGR